MQWKREIKLRRRPKTIINSANDKKNRENIQSAVDQLAQSYPERVESAVQPEDQMPQPRTEKPPRGQCSFEVSR